MKFMTFVTTTKQPPDSAPTPALYQGIMELGMEAMKAGVLVEQGGLLGIKAGGYMRIVDGEIVLTDGPFAEAKEMVGGYAVYDVPDKEQAYHWVRRFLDLHTQHWPEWEGVVEVRQMMDQPPL